MPSGQFGLYSDSADVRFDDLYTFYDGELQDWGGRWANANNRFINRDPHIGDDEDAMKMFGVGLNGEHATFLPHLHLDEFDIVFSAEWWPGSGSQTFGQFKFLFNVDDQYNHNRIILNVASTGTDPSGTGPFQMWSDGIKWFSDNVGEWADTA